MTWTSFALCHPNDSVDAQAYGKLGATFRRLREEQGFSQESFAQFAGIERARYGKIERGRLNISLKVLFQLAHRLKVTPSELMTEITVADCQEIEPES